MAFLAILEFNKLEKKQKSYRSRGNHKQMNKVEDNFDYVEGNTGALGGVNGNDSQTDKMSDARRNKFKPQSFNNPENELGQYTSEEVDRTPMYGNSQMNSSM